MDSIFEKITKAINDFLMSVIESSLSTMFNDVNEKVGTIAAEVGKTPQQWNASVFSIIQTLSENVILPIAGLIITFILCYELITMISGAGDKSEFEADLSFMTKLQDIVSKYDFAQYNGYSHHVSGLPDMYGECIDIKYASGESIYASDNQSGFIPFEAIKNLVKLFDSYT